MIRRLETKDINKVMDIWLASTIKAHPFISEEYWKESYKIVKEVYMPHAQTFVYEAEGIIQGFISIIEEEFIGALFISIEAQGRGIGSQLLDYALEKYRKLGLAVYTENTQAIKFYIAQGFKVIVEQDNKSTNYKEYIMQKDIG